MGRSMCGCRLEWGEKEKEEEGVEEGRVSKRD